MTENEPSELAQIADMWLYTLSWMAGLTVGFAVLERITPCNPGMYWWRDRRAAATDLIYWFIQPLFVRVFRIYMLLWGAALVMGTPGDEALDAFFRGGYGLFGHMPIWLQGVLIMLGQDLALYWIHRLFHGGVLWRFHAVHHSPGVLDWMSTQRFHIVNSLLAFSLVDVLTLLMGFSPTALFMLVPFNLAYSALVHSNLNWTFGPLRHVMASPVFHRWHHTAPDEGGSKNFAPTFPFLDVIFGTFYMPKGRLPERYGVSDPDFPQGFLGQLLYPFRQARGKR